jgi:hypothetical protein
MNKIWSKGRRPSTTNDAGLSSFLTPSVIWRTLPEDIVIQHIMPYTYRKQSPQLLFDIRNYYDDYALVDEYYNHNYNQYMWLTSILCISPE